MASGMADDEWAAANIQLDLAIGRMLGDALLGRNQLDVDVLMASVDAAELEEMDAENQRRLFGD